MDPLLDQLVELNLPEGDWALFGSGPLLARGWIDEAGDLDVISRGEAWSWAKRHGVPEVLDDGSVIYAFGDVTIGDRWKYGEFSVDVLIDTADDIAGIPCVRLEHVETFKRIAGRPKDRHHLDLIEAHTQ